MSIFSLVILSYVGPGAGLGALGALFAVIAAVMLGVVGLLLYPIQLFRKWVAAKAKINRDAAVRSSDQAPAA